MKYTFEESTIGDFLDNPETADFLFRLIPEAKDHPMLEVGKPFTLEQAMPFIETIAEGMGISGDEVAERVVNFKAQLETFNAEHGE